MIATDWLGAKKIYHHTDGAPFQPRDLVVIVAAIDVEIHDVSSLIGQRGTVEYLEYSCGCGQEYPHTPMIGIRLEGAMIEEFWPEEIARVS